MTHTVYIDLTSEVARAATTGTALPSVNLKLRTAQKIEFAFMTSGTVAAVSGWVSGKVCIKEYPTDNVFLLDTTLTESGADTTKRYSAAWDAADCDSTALRTFLGAATLAKECFCELEWTDTNGTHSVAFASRFAPTFLDPEDVAPDPIDSASWEWLKERAPEANGFTHDDEARELGVSAGSLDIDTDSTFAANSDAKVPSQKAVKTAMDLKAPLASPTFTGTPAAPTPADGTNTTQIATTAFVQSAIAALVASSPSALDTLNELAAALGNDANYATTVTNALALKAPLASPTFTGTPAAPTAAGGTNTTQIATTAFVQAALGSYLPLAGGTLTGALINSANGAASTPGLQLTGAPYAAGTATTNKALLLLEPAGTTSTGWSTSGTMFGVNAASAFVGNLLDLQLNGSSKFKVTYDGQVVCGDYSAAGTLRLNPGLGSGGAYLTLDASVNGRTIRAYDAQFYVVGSKQYLIAGAWGDAADVSFARSSAGVARIANGSTGRATLDAAGYQVGGVAGASGGPFTTITSITVVNGIITAISGS